MSEIIKPASMSDVSQQIIDIIEANKQTPGIAAFLQALKPALVRYSGNDVMKMNERLVSMINEINSEQTGAPLMTNSDQMENPTWSAPLTSASFTNHFNTADQL